MRTNLDQGVLSLHIKHHPRLVGRSIRELFSLGGDIPVFALARGNNLIWNPNHEIQLRFDDVLICYGEFKALRHALKGAMRIGLNNERWTAADVGSNERSPVNMYDTTSFSDLGFDF